MGYPGDEEHDAVQQQADQAADGAAEGDHQLTLTGADDTLPWLASDEVDEDEGGGADYRILIFAVLALLALGGILWGAKTFFDRTGAASVVADGSTVEAPAGDYKERPADPGGQDVAGTGDLSYEVGEGVSREGQLASADDANGTATPSVDVAQGNRPGPSALAPTPATTPTRTPATAARTNAGATGGVGVQVGAYQSREGAETGWSQLSSRYSVLQGVSHRVIEGTVDSGTIYRLQAVAANGAAADAMCREIRNAGGDCQVKR